MAGKYDLEARASRRRAKTNIWWMWFNIVFAAVNVVFVVFPTRLWVINAVAAVLLAVLAVLMFKLSRASIENANERDELSRDVREFDMGDHPLDYRADGSIRPGDPAYDFMMGVIDSGEAKMATRRDDGLWEVK